MLNLLRAEILKQGRLKLIMLIAISPAILTWLVLGTLVFMKIGGADFGNVPNSGSATLDIGAGTFALASNILIVSMGGLYLIGLVIIGGMVGSNEYSWHTIKMLATREPSRPRIILSKTLFLVTLGAFMAVILLFGWLLLGLVFKVLFNPARDAANVDGNAIANGLRYLVSVFLVYLIWSFLTMFLAVRFKSVVVAIIFYFVINTLDGIVSSLGAAALNGQLGTRFPNWLEPLINIAEFISPFLVNFSLNQLTASPQNVLLIKNVSPVQSGLVLLVWAGLFIWATVSVFNKRDITE